MLPELLGVAARFRSKVNAVNLSVDAVSPQARSVPQPSAAGRWFLAGMGISIALIGGLFVFLMGRSFLRAREIRHWTEVKCVILSSEVEERKHDEFSPIEYRHDLSYGYEWKGTAFTGDHLTLRSGAWTSNRKVAAERAADYPVGKATTCLVNPADPAVAVLKPDSLAPGYSIWFPCLFVVGGSGIVFRALTAKNR